MPFNASGVYSLPAGPRPTAGQTALASQVTTPDDDIAASLSLTLLRDGRAPMDTGKTLTLGRDAASALEAVTKQQLDASTSRTRALGNPYYIPANTQEVVNVPAEAATIQDAIDGVQFWTCGPGASIKILVTGHQAGVSAIATIYRPDNGKLIIAGTDPKTFTFSSFDTPGGTLGARTLGINVTDATDAAVGDVLILGGYAQDYPDSGSRTAGTAPVKGAYEYAYLLGSGNCLVTITAGTPNVTFSQAVNTTEVPVGAFLSIGGEMRRITARGTTTTATVASNWRQSYASHIYWRVLAAEQGTISATAGAVTGSGTNFLSRVSPGDILIVPELDIMSAVLTVTNDTTLGLENSITLGAGTFFAIINRPWEVSGAFEITAKSGNKLTVSIPSWCEYNVPFRGLTPTTIKAVKSSVKANAGSTSGVTCLSAGVEFDNIAIKGVGSTGIGVKAGGATGGAGTITFTNDAPVIGFNEGVHAEGSYEIRAQNAYATGGTLACMTITNGANGYFDNVNCYGGGVYSMLLDGGHVYFSRADLNCSYEDGLRLEVGGSAYGDWVSACSHGGRAVQSIGATELHIVGGRAILCGNIGTAGALNFQNGGNFRASGFTAIRNRGYALLAARGSGEASYFEAFANSSGGISADGASQLVLDRLALTSNFGRAIDAANKSVVIANTAHVWGNSGAILANSLAEVITMNSVLYGNGANEVNAVGGGTVYCQGYLGSPNFAVSLNKFLQAGASIRTDVQIAMGP